MRMQFNFEAFQAFGISLHWQPPLLQRELLWCRDSPILGSYLAGMSVNSCAFALCTAAAENGDGKVAPPYQAFH